jgi:hypothetical protein
MSILLHVVMIVVVTMFTIYCIHFYTGWTYFTMQKGQNFAYSLKPELVSNIVFKKCLYSVVSETGKKGPIDYDVTKVLNAMIQNYQGNYNDKYIFKLDDPGLSAFSFNIPDFNDTKVHPTGEWLDTNPNQTVTLTGYYKLLGN